MRKFIVAASFAVLLCGCASSASDIPTQYISPLTYRDYTCSQIQGEMESVSRRVAELAGQVDKRASGDAVKMGVGLILLWPTLFFISGDGPQAVEYGRLKGEFEALEKAAIRQNCGINVQEIKPVEKKPEEKPKDVSGQKKITD